jgi:hypothetical protein
MTPTDQDAIVDAIHWKKVEGRRCLLSAPAPRSSR